MLRLIKFVLFVVGALMFAISAPAKLTHSINDVSSLASVTVNAQENGFQRTGQQLVWHDQLSSASADDALKAFLSGKFQPLQSAGSTGLKPGAFWTIFELDNQTEQSFPLLLEYIDHQLIQLDAYQVDLVSGNAIFLHSLSMEAPFSERLVEHPRLVLPVELPANTKNIYLVRMNSHEAGYVFPSMRIWSEKKLVRAILIETGLVGFLFGGFFLNEYICSGCRICQQSKRIFYLFHLCNFKNHCMGNYFRIYPPVHNYR